MCCLLGCAFAWCLLFHYRVLFFVVPFYVLPLLLKGEHRRLRRLASDRQNENICDFVRKFDWRRTDTWVLRAVYEELSRHLAVDRRSLPIRADDYLWEDGLGIDSEDLDDLALAIAARAGRSLDDTRKNPFYGGKVQTIRDLVAFMEHQPRLALEHRPVV